MKVVITGASICSARSSASRVLGEELGIEPGPELRRIEEQILLHDQSITPVGNTPSLPVPAPTGGSVPRRLTSFVGRTDELDELNAVLSEVALVTLVGPGGAGKTRLALELADGLDVPAFFIDLARVAPGSPVEEAVAEGLGGAGAPGVVPRPATPAAMIKDRLGGRAAILILDNCEHVIESAARLAEAVVTELEGVRVVATSRQRLGVPGEQVWRTPSLMVGVMSPDRRSCSSPIGPRRSILLSRSIRRRRRWCARFAAASMGCPLRSNLPRHWCQP